MSSRIRSLRGLLQYVFLADLGLFIVVGLVCIIGGWRTWAQYATGLAWGGALALLVGILSTLGGWQSTRSATFQYGSSAGEESPTDRARREIAREEQGFGFLARMFLVSVVLFVAALGINALIH